MENKHALEIDPTGFNDPPKGWEVITKEEFAASDFFSYCITYVDYKQIIQDRDGVREVMPVHLFYMNTGTHFGMYSDRDSKMRFFRFGCHHDFRSENIGKCLHRWTCKKCGQVRIVDSSD